MPEAADMRASRSPLASTQVADVSVFDYGSHVDYLRAVHETMRQRSPRRQSLNDWAARLGFRSPRGIAMVLKGQRLPSFQMTQAIAKALKLTRNEQRFFELQVALARATAKGQPTDALTAEMAALSPSFQRRTTVSTAAFSYISAWYHIVLKQLVGTPGFQEDPAWIQRRLRRKVSAAEIRGSLKILQDLNMIRRRDDGRLEVTEERVQTQPDVPSAAVRSHLKGMLGRAAEALEEQPVKRREMATATCRIDPRAIPEVKQRIRTFLDALEDDFGAANVDAVFQINIQFFEHTVDAPVHLT